MTSDARRRTPGGYFQDQDMRITLLERRLARVTSTIGWDAVTDKPATFPSDWSTLGSKPATFPSDWSTLGSKPATFPSEWGTLGGTPPARLATLGRHVGDDPVTSRASFGTGDTATDAGSTYVQLSPASDGAAAASLKLMAGATQLLAVNKAMQPRVMDDTGWLASGLTISPNANISITSYLIRLRDDRVTGQVVFFYSGATITPGSDGNVADTSLFSMPASHMNSTAMSVPVDIRYDGVRQFFGRINPNSGAVLFTHGIPGLPFNSNTTFIAYLDYYIS